MKIFYNKIAVLCFLLTATVSLSATPLPPVQVTVQGMTLTIDATKTENLTKKGQHTEGAYLRGVGEMYVPFLGQNVEVRFSDLRLDAHNQWESGTLVAAIPKDLLAASHINSLERPNFQDNAQGMKQLLTAAKYNAMGQGVVQGVAQSTTQSITQSTMQGTVQDATHGTMQSANQAARQSVRLPLRINELAAYSDKDFGTLEVLITELRFTKDLTMASLMAVERMPEGVYIPFTLVNQPIDPLSISALDDLKLTLKDDANVPDVQLPLAFKKHDPNGTENNGTFIALSCNGLDYFSIEGAYNFSKDKVKPVRKEDAMVVATFKLQAKSLRQFIASVSITPFSIVGADDMVFEISEAFLDYSDKDNPPQFPTDYLTDNNATTPQSTPTNAAATPKPDEKTWKGFFMRKAQFSLPSGLGIKDAQGKAPNFILQDVIFDRGNGMSASLAVSNIPFAKASVEGFSFSLDTLALSVKKNSFQKLSFSGGFTIPVLKDDKGVLKYSATLNLSGDSTKPKAEFALRFAKETVFEVPFLQNAKCTIKDNSRAGVRYQNGKMGVFAELNGSFSIGIKDPEFELALPFEGWTIGETPELRAQNLKNGINTEGGLAMGFKSFSTDGDAASTSNAATTPASTTANPSKTSTTNPSAEAPKKKLAGFPIVLNSVKFQTLQGGVYSLGLSASLNLAGSTSSFSVTAGVTVLAKLEMKELLSSKPWEGIKFQEIKLDTLKLKMDFTKFALDGYLVLRRNDPIYGTGFEAKVKMGVFPNPKLAFEVMAEGMFGIKDNFRYYYVNAEAEFKPGIPLGPLTLYGFGGGMYYNMKQAEVNGKRTYVPEKDYLGFKAMVSIGLPARETFVAKGRFELEFRPEWAFNKFTMTVDAYMMNQVGKPDDEAMMQGNLTFVLDNDKETMTAQFQFKAEKKGVMTATGNADMFFDLKDKNNFFIKIGTPQAPVEFVFFNAMTVKAYFMAGVNLPSPRSLEEINANFKDFPDVKRAYAPVEGAPSFAFGIQWEIPKKQYSVMAFTASVSATMGLDGSIAKMSCGDRLIGFNGWYFQGRAYAYVEAKVDLDVDVFAYTGRINIAEVKVAASLAVALPNPVEMSGKLKGSYSVLCGAVEGNFDFDFTYKQGDPCNNITRDYTPSVIKQSLIAGTLPTDKGTMAVYDEAVVTFNLPMSGVQNFDIVNNEGKIERRYYKCRVERFEIKDGKNVVFNKAFRLKDKDYTAVLTPDALLPADKNLTVFIEVKAYDTDADGNVKKQIAVQTKEVAFKTGAKPDRIVPQLVAYEAPGKDQKYWRKDYARPKVELSRTGMEDLFANKINGIDYEYKWRLSKKEANGNFTAVGTFNLNEKVGDPKLMTYKATCYKDWGWITLPYECDKTGDVPSRTIRFDSLNNLTLDKGATYKLEVIRQPKDFKRRQTSIDTTRKSAFNSDGNTIKVATRELSAVANTAQNEVFILYENTFSISRFDDMSDKVAFETLPKTTVKSLARPNRTAAENYENALPWGSGEQFSLEIKGKGEPLDEFDKKKILGTTSVHTRKGTNFRDYTLTRTIEFTNYTLAPSIDIARNSAVNTLRQQQKYTYIGSQDLINKVFEGGDDIYNDIRGDKLCIVFNGVNLQKAASEMLYRLASDLANPRCQTLTYKCGCSNWCLGGCCSTCSRQICEYDSYEFIKTWYHNYSANAYKPQNDPIEGFLAFWKPLTTPENMFDRVSGDAKKATQTNNSIGFAIRP